MFRKYISLLLSIVLVITLLPGYVHAESDLYPIDKTKLNVTDSYKELVDQRTAESKTFVDDEGNFKKEIHHTPIHHKKNGKWEKISDRLIEKNNSEEVETEDTDLNVKFPKKLNQNKTIRYTFGDYHLSLSVLSATNGEQTIPPGTSKMKTEDNKIIYENVFDGVDLRHITLNDEVKEDWIVNEYNGINQFNYEVKTDLTPKLEENGAVGFYKDQEKKETVFKLPAPLMEDSNYSEGLGNGVKSRDLHYELLQNGKNSYIIKLVVDKKWLESSERVYPVYIDPSVTIGAPGDTFVSSAYPTTNYNKEWDSSQGEYVLKAGYYDSTTGTNYAFMKFSIVGDLKGAIIDSATLKAYVTHAYYATTDTGLWVDRALGQWYADELTWSNKPSSTNITSTSVARDEWASFNVTSTVQNFVDGDYDNFGFKLHTNGNGQTYWKKITAGESANEAKVVITYHYPKMENPTVTATQYGVGKSTGYINVDWQSITGAESYDLQMWDGKSWETIVSPTTATYWSSKGLAMFPKTYNSTSEFSDTKSGVELPTDPSDFYSVKSGTNTTRREYGFRVLAHYPSGNSPWSDEVKKAIPQVFVDIPNRPTVKAYAYPETDTVNKGRGWLDISWTGVTGATGYKVLIYNGVHYEEYRVGKVTNWSTKYSSTNVNRYIWPTDSEISSGRYALHHDQKGVELPIDPNSVYVNAASGYESFHRYSIRIIAESELGDTTFSDSQYGYMPLNTPKNVVVKGYPIDSSKGYLNVSWAAVQGAGGYTVEIFDGNTYKSFDVGNVTSWNTKGKSLFTNITDLPIDPTTQYQVNGASQSLIDSKSYQIRVTAYRYNDTTAPTGENAKISGYRGLSSPSSTVTASLNDALHPIVNSGLDSIGLSWTPVRNAVKYQILNEEDIIIYEGNNKSFTITGLFEDELYQYQLIALDSSNNALTKNELYLNTKSSENPSKTYVNSVVSDEGISFYWQNASYTTKYMIYRDGVNIGSSVTGSFLDTNLQPNTEYLYTIEPANQQQEDSISPEETAPPSMAVDMYVKSMINF